MRPCCFVFGMKNLTKEEVKGKMVIEIGSHGVNGSLRPIIESWSPSEYVGTDIEHGFGVDIICAAENLAEKFGNESFDIVISTDVIEHIRNWKKAISNMKKICKTGGLILIATCSRGFPYHAFPHDFWRYELNDLKEIFSDFKILATEQDKRELGVFIKATKPKEFEENDLKDFELYSIILNKKAKDLKEEDLKKPRFRYISLKNKVRNFIVKKGRISVSLYVSKLLEDERQKTAREIFKYLDEVKDIEKAKNIWLKEESR